MYRLVATVFLLSSTSVLGEECVSNNFESDFDDLFKSDSYVCIDEQPWRLANYTSIDIADVPEGSNRFIEPRSSLTCESTFWFDINEGTLEVNFYMKAMNDDDYLSVLVSEVTSDGHRNRGHESFSRRIPNYKDGWNTLRIDLSSSFNGFISFMAEKSEDSIVLIDSFRYFAKDHEDDCGLYEDIDNDDNIDHDTIESTTESPPRLDPEIETTTEFDTTYPTSGIETTTKIISEEDISTSHVPELETTIYTVPEEYISTTLSSKEETTPYPLPEEHTSTSLASQEETTHFSVPEEELTTYYIPETDATTEPETNYQTTNNPLVETEKCVTYNFENDFDKLFTHDHDLCGDFNKWALSNYSSNGIDVINAKGNSYLAPSEDLSCISAFPIRMSPNGLVEVNVYIAPASELDYIIVLVKNVVDGSVDTVAGSFIYEPEVTSFVKGWNVIRINVVHLRSFDAYLILLGAASEGSTVLVDSFRYIPPWANANDEECQFR